MILTIHQPEYLPWLGFFDRIIQSDIFVILDHVQYQKNGYINRNRIKNANGSEWLTVPVNKKMQHSEISKVEIQNSTGDWREKHYKSLVMNYSKTPYFQDYHDILKEMYTKNWDRIADLDVHFITKILDRLGIKRVIQKSSTMNIQKVSTALLVDICKKFNADTYLSGEGGKRYIDLEAFEKAGIKIKWQTFVHPTYSQQYNKLGFISHLSFIDLLFNHGEESLEILKKSSA